MTDRPQNSCIYKLQVNSDILSLSTNQPPTKQPRNMKILLCFLAGVVACLYSCFHPVPADKPANEDHFVGAEYQPCKLDYWFCIQACITMITLIILCKSFARLVPVNPTATVNDCTTNKIKFANKTMYLSTSMNSTNNETVDLCSSMNSTSNKTIDLCSPMKSSRETFDLRTPMKSSILAQLNERYRLRLLRIRMRRELL